ELTEEVTQAVPDRFVERQAGRSDQDETLDELRRLGRDHDRERAAHRMPGERRSAPTAELELEPAPVASEGATGNREARRFEHRPARGESPRVERPPPPPPRPEQTPL